MKQKLCMFLKVANEKMCFDYCQTTTLCNWFTFSPEQSFCQLFENCILLDLEKCPDCKSGPTNCKKIETKCGIQGECKGITVEHEGMPVTWNGCLKLCNITSGCNWFTFYKNISQCILFETCSISFRENCISGESSCINWKGWLFSLFFILLKFIL